MLTANEGLVLSLPVWAEVMSGLRGRVEEWRKVCMVRAKAQRASLAHEVCAASLGLVRDRSLGFVLSAARCTLEPM